MTPEQRSLIGKIGGNTRASLYDGKEMTAKARSTFLAKFEAMVDPTNELPEGERLRRAEAAKRAYMARLALKSAKKRARKRGG